jgi:hypothetical protein
MPITYMPAQGDGINSPGLWLNVQMPDSGQSVIVQGLYLAASIPAGQALGLPACQQTPIAFGPTTLTAPTVPASGSKYWIAELGIASPATVGTVQAKSGVAAQTPDTGNVVVFSQVIPSTAPAAMSQQGGFTFPLSGVGEPN